eukprot:1159287-Pelagomonas_calceolata.AAC.1
MGVFRGQMQHLNDHAGAVVGLVLSDLLFVSLKIPQLWSDEGSDRVLGSIKLFQTKRWQIYGYVCCLPPAANLRLPVKDQQGSASSTFSASSIALKSASQALCFILPKHTPKHGFEPACINEVESTAVQPTPAN